MITPYLDKILVTDRHDLDEQLGAAVDRAIQQALQSPGWGVLVTRRDDQNIIVQLSEDVSFGTTIERDLRPNSPHGQP